MPDGWDDAVRFVNDIAALSERLVAEEVRFAIDAAWPVQTAWSRANNRVGFGDSPSFPIEPPNRPSEPLALAVFADANVERDLRRLEGHTTPGPISIGNAVPYARDVGFIDQNGSMIYAEAGTIGANLGVRRVGQEWQRAIKRL